VSLVRFKTRYVASLLPRISWIIRKRFRGVVTGFNKEKKAMKKVDECREVTNVALKDLRPLGMYYLTNNITRIL
jgi:hypothetical protein